jgi:hypothetical protein
MSLHLKLSIKAGNKDRHKFETSGLYYKCSLGA